MPRGRPKGSTGIYSRWTPEKIAELFEDADLLADYQKGWPQRNDKLPVNRRRLAKLLTQAFPGKYRDNEQEREQLRQLLTTKAHEDRKSLDARDTFNAAILARLLGETT
jgi:hypothetical protein